MLCKNLAKTIYRANSRISSKSRNFIFMADLNLLKRIVKDVQVNMSAYWKDFNASKAIDFDNRTSADLCHCCSGTVDGPSWWSIDLGSVYLIKTIVFIGRSDSKYHAIHYCCLCQKEWKIKKNCQIDTLYHIWEHVKHLQS